MQTAMNIRQLAFETAAKATTGVTESPSVNHSDAFAAPSVASHRTITGYLITSVAARDCRCQRKSANWAASSSVRLRAATMTTGTMPSGRGDKAESAPITSPVGRARTASRGCQSRTRGMKTRARRRTLTVNQHAASRATLTTLCIANQPNVVTFLSSWKRSRPQFCVCSEEVRTTSSYAHDQSNLLLTCQSADPQQDNRCHAR